MADKIENHKSIRNLQTPAELTAHLDQLRRDRQDRELEWRLNLSFYRGDQWVWKGLDGRLWGYPVADGEKPRNRVRITSNQILPNVNAYVAQLMKTKPVIRATPDSTSERDITAAQVADDLNKALWRELDIHDKFAESLHWAVIAEVGWLKVSYDPWAGEPVKFMVDPEGNVIPNQDLQELYTHFLQQSGEEPQYIALQTGDLRVDALSPFQVYTDPTARVFSDAQYAYCVHPMSPDEVYTRFGVWVEPDSSKDSNEALRPWRGSKANAEPEIVNVHVGYFRPGPVIEDGRYVVWIRNQEKAIIDKKWDLPTRRLPLIPLPGIRVPGSVEWEALVTHARPIQKEINKTLSQIVIHKDLSVTPRYWAPAGSFEGTRITNESGVIRYYNPVSGMKPEAELPAPVPEYVLIHLQDLQGRMDRLFNLQAITRGDVPPNVEAGIAIDLLQEAAVDQVAPQIQAIEEALVDLGELLVAYADRYYTEPRQLKIIGEGGVTRVRTFKTAQANGGFSFHCEAGSGLPRTRAGRMARIQQLIAMGVVNPAQAWKHFELADLAGVQQLFAADEDLILREHDALLKGDTPLNEVEFSRAMAALQSGVNIYTQQPVQSEQEAQQILQDAALTPLPYENSAMHHDSHALKMKSPEYAQYPTEIKARFQRHFELTKQKLMSETPDDPKSMPRTSLTLHGTVGPTVASKILQKNKVDAAPQELLEPPLETLVMDSVDQVDKDDAANDPLTQYEQQMQILEAQLKVAEAQNKLQLAEQRFKDNQQPDTAKELQMMETLQRMEHADEKQELEVEKAAQEAAHKQRMHAQEVRHKEVEKDEKVRTSRASRRAARRKEKDASSS